MKIQRPRDGVDSHPARPIVSRDNMREAKARQWLRTGRSELLASVRQIRHNLSAEAADGSDASKLSSATKL